MRPKNLQFLVWGTVLLFAFLLLLFLETRSIFILFDPGITTWLQTLIPRSLDVPLSFFSLAGNIEPTSLLILFIGTYIFYREKRIYYPLILFGAVAVFELIGKLVLYHPGPPMNFFRFSLPFELPHLYVKTASSFPSGHVSRTMFLVVIGLFLITKYVKNSNQKLLLTAICYLLSALMIVSRVYLGEHWTSDVLGGVFLGSSMALFSIVYY